MTNSVLLVEDSMTQRELVRAQLQAAGFEVVSASNGHAALEMLSAQPVDLVLSDIVMPNMDGYELCRRVKERDPDLPVVLLTSLTDPVEVVHGLEAGADNFLRKNHEGDQLIARLRTMLSQRASRSTADADPDLEVVVKGKRFLITTERQQILNLLVSSFEDLVDANEQLRDREEALTAARDELHHQLDATERERRRLGTVLEAVPHAMVITDAQGIITDASDRLAELIDTPREECIGRSLFDVVRYVTFSGEPVRPEQRPLQRALTESQPFVEMGGSFDLLLETQHGPVPVIVRAAAVRDRTGRPVAAVSAMHEIGGLAAHDARTKLPNQTLFVDRVTRSTELSAKEGTMCAVLAVAVDRFSRLRERLSPSAADHVLSELATRLRCFVEDPDVEQCSTLASASYFGDETFGVVLPRLHDEVDGVRLAHLIAERLSGPITADDVSVTVTTTVAAVFDTCTDTDALQLVSAAVTAARRASLQGGDTVEIVDPTVGTRAGDELRREAQLRDAIEQGTLEVYYQPQVTVRSEVPVALEALVRWRHPVEGLISPGEFIPLAEETGLVVPLGWWVLREACQQTARWRAQLAGADNLSVSVNLATAQLNVPDVAERVAAILADTGLEPCALILEVTESGVVADADIAAQRLEALAKLGVRIAIDDFGTGYSSLLQLRRFPVHALKIDRAFVDGMCHEPEDAAIVAASVRLAQTLDLEAVAEGVETPEQLTELRALRCDLAQGFLWSPALPAPDLEQWWIGSQAPTPAFGHSNGDRASVGGALA